MSQQGRHGEAKFAELCQNPNAKTGAVVNRASDDQHGWDYVIDLAPQNNANLPADLQTSLIQCFAQVKTTNQNRLVAKLKLSNALKSAKSPLPSFVFLLHYQGDVASPVVYGRHIWAAEIATWLKFAREIEVNGKKQLNKVHVSLKFTKAEQIDTFLSDWMLEKIENISRERYSSKKTSLIGLVGYGEFSSEITMNIGPLASQGDIVRHEIGLIEDLPVVDFRMHDIRFDIKSLYPVAEHSGGRVSFTTKAKDGLFILTSAIGEMIEIPAKIWIPNSVTLGDPDYKTRTRAGHINLVASQEPGQQRFHALYDVTSRYTLLEQLGFLCLLNWSQKGDVSFRVEVEGVPLLSGNFSQPFRAEDWMPQFEATGHHLVQILGVEKSKEVSVSLDEMEGICKQFSLVSSLVNTSFFRFQFASDTQLDSFDKLIGFFYGEIGPWTFGIIYEAAYKERSQEGALQFLYFESLKMVKKMVVKQQLNITRQKIKEDFDIFHNELATPVARFQQGDLVELSEVLAKKGEIVLSIDDTDD